MTLRMPAQLLDQVRREGERAYPSECCGAIANAQDCQIIQGKCLGQHG
jgi:proteasome lid subunit RPN8/RPN11